MRQPGEQLLIDGSRYTVSRVVYEGDQHQSFFYEAIEAGLNRKVGIKEILGDDATLDRAFREVQVIIALQHERVPRVLRQGRTADALCLVLEWIEGTTLRTYMEQAGAAATAEGYRRSLRLLIEVCRVLETVHRAGYFHRDLKPENILLRNGRPFLIDYGLTAAPRRAGEGTRGYAAPEQTDPGALARRLGPEVDPFALGRMLYELLTGRLPTWRARGGEWMRVEWPAQANPALPAEVDAVVRRAVAFQPAARYGRVLELRQALERVLDLPFHEVEQQVVAAAPAPATAPAPVPRIASGGEEPPPDLRERYNELLAAFNLPRHITPVLNRPAGEVGRAHE